MIGMKLKAAKGLFFDRARVINTVDRTTRRNLSRFGSFVRQRARSSIRARKRISEPGLPPPTVPACSNATFSSSTNQRDAVW